MKKLRSKVFWVIFSLLTIFTLVIFITSTTRSYIEKKNNITETLIRMNNIINDDNEEFQEDMADKDSRRMFLDSQIYTIVFDDNGDTQTIYNNSYDDSYNKKNIAVVAKKIINKANKRLYVGNLYTNRYSYVFPSDNVLIIMDNNSINNMLLSQLLLNLILFILGEIIIFIITYLITEWITTPVNESFEKQKTFIADASHELKTPLSVMIASCDAYFNDKDEKWIHNMKNESERMIKLVTELLDLAKTEEELDISMEDNNLSDIVEGSILTFESLFYENNIKLKYDIEPNIKMICNEGLITELMDILIDNAIKHCSNKGKVFAKLYKKNKQITLEVKNTGNPIKKEEEEKIFERFYKVDSSRNRNSNNYGLGLAIAKNIVLRHNGKISAHSDNGYTTFIIIWNQK